MAMRRGLDESAGDLGRLDPDAIARVRDEAAPDPRDPEELHQVLSELVVVRPEPAWAAWFAALVADGRAAEVAAADGRRWFVTEQRAAVDALFPEATVEPDVLLPASLRGRPRPDVEAAAEAAIRGHLEVTGPCTADDLAARTGLARPIVESAIARLEAGGVLLRGWFTRGVGQGRGVAADPIDAGPPTPAEPCGAASGEEVCDRRLLARIHRYTRERLRREIEPVTAQDLLRFLFAGSTWRPRRGSRAVVACWPPSSSSRASRCRRARGKDGILAARVAEYRTDWLDDLCLSGAVAWARLGPRPDEGPRAAPDPAIAVRAEDARAPDEPRAAGRGRATPSRATPLALVTRDNLPWLLLAGARARGALAASRRRRPPDPRLPDRSGRALLRRHRRGDPPAARRGGGGALGAGGARPRDGRRVRDRAGAAVPARSLGSAIGRHGRRGRAAPADAAGPERRGPLHPARRNPRSRAGRGDAGRSRGRAAPGALRRGVPRISSRASPWRCRGAEVLRALRRLEARGVARGGRFVTGFVGEQYALPEAVDALRRTRAMPRTGELVRVLAVDPLNLVGILTPGPRIPAVGASRRHLLRRAPDRPGGRPPLTTRSRRRLRMRVSWRGRLQRMRGRIRDRQLQQRAGAPCDRR